MEALAVANPSYLEQDWYHDIAPIQQEMCLKNPTEDTEWHHEAFETGELPLIPEVCNESILRERIHHVLVAQQGNDITHLGPVVMVDN